MSFKSTNRKFCLAYGLICVALVSLAFILIPGCGKKENTSIEIKTERVSYLFFQDAENGTLKKEQGETYVLTLNGVSGDTVEFSNRPAREARYIKTADFIASWNETFGDEPPNAALDFEAKDGTKEVVAIFVLEDPVYDSSTETLTYKVTDIEMDPGMEGMTTQGTLLEQLPEELGGISLFIDSTITLVNNTEEKVRIAIFMHFTATYEQGQGILRIEDMTYEPEYSISLSSPHISFPQTDKFDVITWDDRLLELKLNESICDELDRAIDSGSTIGVSIQTPRGYSSPPITLQVRRDGVDPDQ